MQKSSGKKMTRALAIVCIALLAACGPRQPETVVEEETLPVDLSDIGKPTLSSYGFFTGPLHQLQPAEGVIPYELNSALFTDYAHKKRFIKFPAAQKATYHDTDVLTFPEGTVLIKNFYYPADFRAPEKNWRILETRLLVLDGGTWRALPYIWNEEQTEAYLDVAGKTLPVAWTHTDGTLRTANYSIPNANQCKGCHLRGNTVVPIGPTARQLNGTLPGHEQIQLIEWQQLGRLDSLPAIAKLPRLAAYDNPHESIDARARAWLEVNCAHCHRPDGPGKTSGLHLLASVTDRAKLGIGKAPVAAGKGSGGRLYSIVPGQPDQSILLYRIESTHPGIMMPELGRTLVHEEGVALVRKWITELK
jgi:uncharacterized repeat protein (TIGR03806 family)